MGAATSLAATGLNAALQIERTRREDRQISRAREREESATRRELEKERKEAAEKLRSARATRRAEAAAAGVADSASSRAILRGLERDAAEADRELRETARARLGAIRSSARNRRADNLLDFGAATLGGFSSSRSRNALSRSLFD